MARAFWFLCAVLATSAAPVLGKETPEQFEARITAELRAQAPEAESLFVRANQARETRDHATAADLYAQVCKLAPHFVHAQRRLGWEQFALGKRPEAIRTLRAALNAQDSSYNEAALAFVLASGDTQGKSSKSEMEEALKRARRATDLEPENVEAQSALCEIAMRTGDLPLMQGAVNRLQTVAPKDIGTWYYTSIAHLGEGHVQDALQALDRAHQFGMPDADYARMHAALEEKAHPHRKLRHALSVGLWVVAFWLALLVVLLGTGLVLSRLALRRAGRMPGGSHGRVTGLDALVRRTYSTVLWLCCFYFYASMPILLVLVLGLGGGLIYGFFAIGHVPVQLVVIVFIVIVGTVGSVIRSLVVRARDQDPGLRLDLARHPRLRNVLDRVAERVGTRAADNVYMTPGTEIAVMERGSMLRQLRGQRERCLILGAGVLEGLALGPFESVLAHEYGHFSNRDTAGGGFALAVRRSLLTMAARLAASGAAAWYNPAWLFLNGFFRVFLRVSQGASRLQEVLADRWAAFSYGSDAFVTGLTHVIRRSVAFDVHVSATVRQCVEGKEPLPNLYSFRPEKYVPSPEEIADATEKALQAAASAYDSHPSPSQRIAWVRALNAPPPDAEPEEGGDVWTLFDDRAEIEALMTEQVRRNVEQRYHVKFALAAAE